MPTTIMRDIHLGGLSDSIFSGIPNSIPRLVGWNLHDIPGQISVNQRMTAESVANVPDEFCKYGIDCSNGIKYWFSSTSGKIWQEKNGTYSLVYTTSAAAGESKCLGAYESQSYIYYFTELRVHRIAIGGADGAANWTANIALNWATFSVGSKVAHPSKEVNLVLYIGDGYKVAQVDAGVFSNTALTLPSQYVVTTLGKTGTSLLTGTRISATIKNCSVFIWNTWSDSFNGEKPISECGVNAFIQGDGFVLANCGLEGRIYSVSSDTNGLAISMYKWIPGVYSPTAKAIVNDGSTAMYKAYPIFGVSNSTGNPCDEGVYSIARHGIEYPLVLNLEFPTSNVDGDGYPLLTGIEIGAMIVSNETLYMSTRKNGSTISLDKMDYSNKIAKPFMEFRAIKIERSIATTFKKFSVPYILMPDSCSIVLKHKKNHATSFLAITTPDVLDGTALNDVDRMVAYLENNIDACVFQLKVEAVTSGNNGPVIEEAQIDY